MSKIAAIQMCSTTNVDENLKQAALLIAEAASEGAQLAVLPEMFPLFGFDTKDKVLVKEEPGSGKIQDFLATISQKYGIWIVGGTIPLSSNDQNKIKAACLVFDSTGLQIGRYDKIHLFDVQLSEQEFYRESDSTEPGKDLTVIDTPLGKLGLCVCFDLRFPDLFHKLFLLGAEIIAVPSAFTKQTGHAHWEILMRCRAIDSFCYMIGACQGGKHHNNRETYGHSMIINPWGEIVAQAKPSGSGIIYSEIDLQNLYAIRKQIPI